MQKRFKKDEEMIKQSVELSKKYYKKAKSTESVIVYAKSLVLVDKYDDAIKTLNKGIEEAEKKGEATKSLEVLLNAVEKKKA